jgi:uncharacterized protein YdaU (DUF1376 family)
MHYFKRNIGDYHKKAGRLSMIEHGAYTLLMDACYDREQFPTLEQAYDWCWARTDDEKAAVRFVLEKFFFCQDGIYSQSRIQEEIARFHENSSINARIAREREEKRRTNRERTVNGQDTNRHLTNNHKPITNNQEKTIRRQAALSCPEGVKEQVWKDFLATRKAALTETALAIIVKEAGKAGWSLESALQECTVRGWRGFKADWVKEKTFGSNKQEDLEARNRAVVERLLEKEAAHGNA